MRRLSPHLGSIAASVVASFALAAGCNAVLDNDPGVLRPASGDEAGAADRGPASQDDDTATSPVSGTGPDAPGAGCGGGEKSCGGRCVPIDDPRFGCGATACAACNLAKATSECVDGVCGVLACAHGFADCNGDPDDGCEADLERVDDCGACGNTCSAKKKQKHVVPTCVRGACGFVCEPGFADCRDDRDDEDDRDDDDDGCEHDLMNDKRNCGACGHRCVFGRCELGRCVVL